MDYVFGRTVLAFLGLTSIIMLVLGVFVALAGIGVGFGSVADFNTSVALQFGIAGAIPGMSLSLLGLILLAMTDHFAASYDTASNTKKMLRVAEEQLQVSRQALKVGALTVPGYREMSELQRKSLLGEHKPTKRGLFGIFNRGSDEPATNAEVAEVDQRSASGRSTTRTEGPHKEPLATQFSDPPQKLQSEEGPFGRLGGDDRRRQVPEGQSQG